MNRTMQSVPRVGMWLAFVCLLLLGLLPVISNGRPGGASALTFGLCFTTWQLLFSLPLLGREWSSGQRGVFAPTLSPAARRRQLVLLVFTGGLFALSTWAYVLAFETVGAVNAAIALQAYPLFAAGLEAAFLGRKKSPVELAFTLLIVVGLYSLATRGSWRMAGLSPWFAVALAVPALWSVAHVIIKELLVTTPITPNQVTCSRLAVSSLCLLPLALAIDGPAAVARAVADPRLQLFALTMGLTYYVELILWFNAVRHIDVSLASTITVPAPAVTMVLAILLLGEPTHGFQLVALALVGLGLFGLLRASSRRLLWLP
jgi:drug/metabolite transporter (DMT)-like permease